MKQKLTLTLTQTEADVRQAGAALLAVLSYRDALDAEYADGSPDWNTRIRAAEALFDAAALLQHRGPREAVVRLTLDAPGL